MRGRFTSSFSIFGLLHLLIAHDLSALQVAGFGFTLSVLWVAPPESGSACTSCRCHTSTGHYARASGLPGMSPVAGPVGPAQGDTRVA